LLETRTRSQFHKIIFSIIVLLILTSLQYICAKV